MKLSTQLNYVTSAILLMFSANSYASQDKAGVIQTESGIDITPGMNASLKYDDNIASSDIDKQDSWILAVTPAVQAQLLDGNNIYTVEAAIEYGEYFDSRDDNYLDALLKARTEVEINQSNRFDLSASYIYGHEDRGTGIFEGNGEFQNEPNTYDALNIGGYYEYGARTTPARVRLNANFYQKDYTNYKQITQFRNYSDGTLGATVFYDTQSASSIFLDFQAISTTYDVIDPSGDRDSETQNLKLGFQWEATSNTEGSLKIGYQNKRFDNTDREDFSGLAWDAKLTWKPLTYSQFDFSTGSGSKDPNGFGDYVQETTFSFSWDHDWSELLGSSIGYKRTKDEYTGVVREDTINIYQLSVNYSLVRWLTLKAGVDIADNSSTESQYQFDRNVYYLTAEMTL